MSFSFNVLRCAALRFQRVVADETTLALDDIDRKTFIETY
tara:strand:+ start:31961 stop:32080 length:120 start_codon:yes stop_codon:yes gene_type:complete